ncbi:MAG: hypothetical protein IJP54_03920, partial [Synergistaceae bacterium]|nr:hypothetical protein [Synergistaceae bacterium]
MVLWIRPSCIFVQRAGKIVTFHKSSVSSIMPENINDLQKKIDFLVNGGALKLLTDLLSDKGIKAL